ncbi:hypothetical protein EV426DRAFT_641332 [Tirmania nivea]|nr:hypothetical protein EV426DRAFT_641332 [Tirmania nivea]
MRWLVIGNLYLTVVGDCAALKLFKLPGTKQPKPQFAALSIFRLGHRTAQVVNVQRSLVSVTYAVKFPGHMVSKTLFGVIVKSIRIINMIAGPFCACVTPVPRFSPSPEVSEVDYDDELVSVRMSDVVNGSLIGG